MHTHDKLRNKKVSFSLISKISIIVLSNPNCDISVHNHSFCGFTCIPFCSDLHANVFFINNGDFHSQIKNKTCLF